MNVQGYAAALLLVGFLGAFLPTAVGEAPAGPETVICKAVGDTKTEADAYGADDKVRPAVVWIHGGALILGSRKGVPGQLLERLKQAARLARPRGVGAGFLGEGGGGRRP